MQLVRADVPPIEFRISRKKSAIFGVLKMKTGERANYCTFARNRIARLYSTVAITFSYSSSIDHGCPVICAIIAGVRPLSVRWFQQKL
jgi:hypothetical protein